LKQASERLEGRFGGWQDESGAAGEAAPHLEAMEPIGEVQ
jgi:hypothetical protein